jgi:hypothetical protein
VHPIVTYFLARGNAPVESLAVFPVVRSLVFMFSCLGLSYQEVGIALLGEHGEGYVPLQRFATWLALVSTAGLSAIAFSPLAEVWYRQVSSLAPELVLLSHLPTRILALIPALTVYLSMQRSVYMAARRTGPLTTATVMDVAMIITTLHLGTRYLDLPGIVVAAAALVAGRCAGILWLRLPRRQVLQGLVDKDGSRRL